MAEGDMGPSTVLRRPAAARRRHACGRRSTGAVAGWWGTARWGPGTILGSAGPDHNVGV
jgi:hypothetical protein